MSAFSLVGAMLAVTMSAITDDDVWMHGAGLGLLIHATTMHVSRKLRER